MNIITLLEYFGLVKVFCPTGPGGGVDPTCSPGGGRGRAMEQLNQAVGNWNARVGTTVTEREMETLYRAIENAVDAEYEARLEENQELAEEQGPLRVEGPDDAGTDDDGNWVLPLAVVSKE